MLHWLHMGPVNLSLHVHWSSIFMVNGILQSQRSAARLGIILSLIHVSHPVEKSELGSLHVVQLNFASKRGFLHKEHVSESYCDGHLVHCEPVHFAIHALQPGGAIFGFGHEMLQNGNCNSLFTHAVQSMPSKPALQAMQSGALNPRPFVQ